VKAFPCHQVVIISNSTCHERFLTEDNNRSPLDTDLLGYNNICRKLIMATSFIYIVTEILAEMANVESAASDA
jgi:hypothetical protein